MGRYAVSCLAIFATLWACKGNIFRGLDRPLSIKESALLALEENDPERALAILHTLLPQRERLVLTGDQSSVGQKKDIIRQYFGKQSDYMALCSIYAIATAAAAGISLLKVLNVLSKAKTDSPEEVLHFLLSNVTFNRQSIKALDLSNVVSELNTSDKEASLLLKETLLMLLGVVGRIALLDTDGNHATSPQELTKLPDADAASISYLIRAAPRRMEEASAKNPSPTYRSLAQSLGDLERRLGQQPGEDVKARVVSLFTMILKDSTTSTVSALRSYHAAPGEPVVAARPIRALGGAWQEVRAKADLYRKLVKVDDHGWILDTKCDGLLFNSLFAVGGGRPDIRAARDDNGEWFRHHDKDCLKVGESLSSISRDMMWGLAVWLLVSGELTLTQELIRYGEKRANAAGRWVLGEGPPERVEASDDLMEALRNIAAYLAHAPLQPPHDEIWTPLDGFRAHLQALSFYIDAQVRGGLFKAQIALLGEYAQRSPRNALFVLLHHLYSDGNMDEVIAILNDDRLFPKTHLPTSNERCEFYLWQREAVVAGQTSVDWQPCPKAKRQHSGVDLLFVTALLARHAA